MFKKMLYCVRGTVGSSHLMLDSCCSMLIAASNIERQASGDFHHPKSLQIFSSKMLINRS